MPETVRVIATGARLACALVDMAACFDAAYKKTASDYYAYRKKLPKNEFGDDKKLDRVERYQRLATDFAYLAATRAPLLNHDMIFEVYVDIYAADEFKRLLSGRSYLADEFADAHNWFENIDAATRASISPDNRVTAARDYETKLGRHRGLPDQVKDDFLAVAALKLFEKSPRASQLLERRIKDGYSIRFVSMRPYNLIEHDTTQRFARALHYDDKTIYIGTDQGRDEVGIASSKVHELGHGEQFCHVFPKSSEADTGERSALLGKIKGLLEAHSIAEQYLCAAEWLCAGIDPQPVYNSLYNQGRGVVNLLQTSPEAFILNVGTGDMVRQRWKFTAAEMQAPADAVARLAATLPALSDPWKDGPFAVRPLDPEAQRIAPARPQKLAADTAETGTTSNSKGPR